MNKEIIINFCISNAVIIIILETLFILMFIVWVSKKLFMINKRFNAFMKHTQQSARKYNQDLEKADNHSYCIKERNDKILKDMRKIEKILAKYKGEQFNTQINNKITNEIVDNLLDIEEDTVIIEEKSNNYAVSEKEDMHPLDERRQSSIVNYENLRTEYEKSKIIEDSMIKKAVENTSSYYNDTHECKIEKPFVNKTVDNVNKYLKLCHVNDEKPKIECYSMEVMDIPKGYKNQEQKVLYNPLYDEVSKYRKEQENKLKKGVI